MNADTLVIFRQLHTITFVAGAMAVLEYFEIAVANRIKHHFRCFDIGLSDVEVINRSSFLFCRFCVRNQFPDW